MGNDDNYTTRVLIHSGLTARTEFCRISALDTGSPQTFIEDVWEYMESISAASSMCEIHKPDLK